VALYCSWLFFQTKAKRDHHWCHSAQWQNWLLNSKLPSWQGSCEKAKQESLGSAAQLCRCPIWAYKNPTTGGIAHALPGGLSPMWSSRVDDPYNSQGTRRKRYDIADAPDRKPTQKCWRGGEIAASYRAMVLMQDSTNYLGRQEWAGRHCRTWIPNPEARL